MSAHHRQRVLQLLMSRRGEWIPVAEIAEAGGLQYGARLFELRHDQGYQIESRTERVRTGARSHIKQSWFRLCTDRQTVAAKIGAGEAVKPEEFAAAMKDDAQQPNLFAELAERHRDDG